MGCASSKTAEDKEEMSKKRSAKKSSTNGGSSPPQSTSGTTANLQNGKANANISGSLAATTTTATSPKQTTTNGVKPPPSQPNTNNNNNNANAYITTNPNNPNLASSEVNNNNLLLLIEFFKAVGNGELERLRQILANLDEITAKNRIRMTRAELLNEGMADADGLTALSIAAGRKHKDLTEFLADLPEVDVNKASESGITPLLMVAEVGWTDVMRKLLKRGAHVDAAPRGRTAEEAKIAGSTPLIGATKYNNPEAVKLLLQQGANPNHQNQSGISALMLASEQGFVECVKNLCEGGANVELAPSGKTALSMNLSGQTPLFCAAKEGHQEIVRYLLDRGANPNATNHYGVSVLWIPSQRGLFKIVELLLERGADAEIAPSGPEAEERSICGWTPLYAAIKSRQYDVVKLLLQAGANPNAVTSLGNFYSQLVFTLQKLGMFAKN
jgi:ankyrin repeat protein